jgi:hypothetical protein
MFCDLTWTDWLQSEEKKMQVRPCMDEQVQQTQDDCSKDTEKR